MAAINIGSENFASLQIKIFTQAQTTNPSSDYGVISFDHATERIGINGKWYGTSKEEYTTLKNLVDKLDGNASTEGSIKKQIADAISNLVNTKIGSLTGTNIPGSNTTVTDFLTSLQDQLTTLNGGTGTTGSVDQKIGAAVAKINTDNAAAHTAALSAVQGVTINNVPLNQDANHIATGTITANDIQVGTGTSVDGSIKKKLEELQSSISAGGENAVLKLFKDETVVSDKTVHADNSVYELQQGGTTYDATKVVAKFQIEKDSFVKEGKLVYGPSTGLNGGTSQDENESDTPVEGKTTPYLKLVIKTTDNTVENYIYIKADRLVDIYTGSTGAAGTGVDITVGADHEIGATLRIASGTTGANVTGTATSAAGVTRTSITQVANTVSVTTTNGTVTNANVGAGVSVDVAGAANAAYNDATSYVDNLAGSGSTSVTGTQTATASTSYSDAVQVLNGVDVASSGGKVTGVTGTGIYVDKAGAAAKAYSSAVNYTNQVISWEIVSE